MTVALIFAIVYMPFMLTNIAATLRDWPRVERVTILGALACAGGALVAYLVAGAWVFVGLWLFNGSLAFWTLTIQIRTALRRAGVR